MNFQKNINNKIWGEVRNSIKKEFDSQPAQNENYLKTKIKKNQHKLS